MVSQFGSGKQTDKRRGAGGCAVLVKQRREGVLVPIVKMTVMWTNFRLDVLI